MVIQMIHGDVLQLAALLCHIVCVEEYLGLPHRFIPTSVNLHFKDCRHKSAKSMINVKGIIYFHSNITIQAQQSITVCLF